MKFLIFFFLSFSLSFAVKDFIIKPNYNQNVLYKIISNIFYPEKLDQSIQNDNKNIFFYKGHFRVIIGKDYNSSDTIKQLANNLLDIANYVWNKEIVDFGFRLPRNSNKYYIDIYIGNTDAYNPEVGNITIPSDYCGYATAYTNKTPYFVINPDMDLNIIKVTIAHEFFHTVQYAYGFDEVNDDIWKKNIWFLEATAVMMEDEVYDNVNDYINYLYDYLNNTNDPLTYSDGNIEYGKVLFAKYIEEKYGIEKIKKIFKNYETNETILDDLRKEFNFDNLMLGYAKCLANKSSCFKDGKLFPNIKYFSQSDVDRIYYYGIAFIKSGSNNYLNSSNNEYLQEDFNGTLFKKIDINKNGLIVINKQQDFLPINFTEKNNYLNLKIKKGWNLISNIFANKLNLTKLNGIIFWIYRNGKYKAYSNIENLEKEIIKLGYEVDNKNISQNEGFWVYSDKDINLSFSGSNLADNNVSLKNGWQIVGFSSAFNPKYLNAKIIWEYDENWSYYGDEDINLSKIDYIKVNKGYFILK